MAKGEHVADNIDNLWTSINTSTRRDNSETEKSLENTAAGVSPSSIPKSRQTLEPIGNMPPADAEKRYYAMLNEPAMAARLKRNGLRQTPERFSPAD